MASGLGLFWQEFWNNYHTTGAIMPSGPYLAAALVRYVGHKSNGQSGGGAAVSNTATSGAASNDATASDTLTGSTASGREILEVGPGTGAVTQYLVERLGPHDRLTLVELNDQFVTHLQKRLACESAFQKVAERTRILHQRIETVEESGRYDAIVSGLPLNNFEPDDVRSILATFERLLKPGGTVSFFEYVGMRPLKNLVTAGSHRKRLRGVAQAMGDFLGPRRIRRDLVLANITPAWVHHAQTPG